MTVNAPAGVDDSLELLFRAHYGRLVRALTLAAGDREVAADAVQEAFVKAHLHWWRLKRVGNRPSPAPPPARPAGIVTFGPGPAIGGGRHWTQDLTHEGNER